MSDGTFVCCSRCMLLKELQILGWLVHRSSLLNAEELR